MYSNNHDPNPNPNPNPYFVYKPLMCETECQFGGRK